MQKNVEAPTSSEPFQLWWAVIIMSELHLLHSPVPRLCLRPLQFLLMFPAVSQHFDEKSCLSWRINDGALQKQKICQQLSSVFMEEVLRYCPLYVQGRYRGQTSAGCWEICSGTTTGWTDPSPTSLIPSRSRSASLSCRLETWYDDHVLQTQHIWLLISCFLWICWVFVGCFLSLLQDEKNQILTTNVLLQMVKLPCTFDMFYCWILVCVVGSTPPPKCV